MAYNNSHYGYRSSRNRYSTQKRMYDFVDTKYKIDAPTLDEFGITESDIENVKREYEEWKRISFSSGYLKGTKEAYQEQAQRVAWKIIKVLAILSAIVGMIYGSVEYGTFGGAIGYAFLVPFVATAGTCGPVFIGSIIVAGIVAKSKSENTTPKKFLQQDKLDKISIYEEAIKQHEYWQNRKKEEYWRGMNGRTFEKEINDLFLRRGYKTKLCKGGGDGGVDIIALKDKTRIAIQCKAHAKKISPSIARDLLGTISANGFSKGYLITLNGGTNGTIDFCKNNGLILWDIKDILEFQHEE